MEFIGRLERASLARELAGAAMLLMPSRYHEFAPYSALEAMAAGVPVVGVRPGRPAGDARRRALRAAGRRRRARRPDDRALGEPGAAPREGDELIARARASHGEERYVSRLLDLYSRARQ